MLLLPHQDVSLWQLQERPIVAKLSMAKPTILTAVVGEGDLECLGQLIGSCRCHQVTHKWVAVFKRWDVTLAHFVHSCHHFSTLLFLFLLLCYCPFFAVVSSLTSACYFPHLNFLSQFFTSVNREKKSVFIHI